MPEENIELENKVVTHMTIFTDDSSHNTPSYIYAKQYDSNSRYIIVKLMTEDGEVEVSGTPRLNGIKPSGDAVYIEGTIDEENQITFLLTQNLLTEEGVVTCDIRIYDPIENDEVVLTSSNFYITVDKSNYDLDAVQGTDEFSDAVDALVQEVADRAEQAAAVSGYLFFYINEYGQLIMQRTSTVDVDFYINPSDGKLYITPNQSGEEL